MGHDKKADKDDFAIKNPLLESSSSSESEHSSREAKSESELSADEAVRKLSELEWEYRRSLSRNEPLSMNIKKGAIKHFSRPRRLLATANRDLRRELKIEKKHFSQTKNEAFGEVCKDYLNTYLGYKRRIEDTMTIIRKARKNYGRIVTAIYQQEKEVRQMVNIPKVPIKVMFRRLDHLEDNVYRIQCVVNVIVHDNRMLADQIREQLVEFGNHIIQRREIKMKHGKIRRDLFELVEDANSDFDNFYACLEQVNFLGTENNKQNFEFQNALWDGERFRAYDLELEQFYKTKLTTRPMDENAGNRITIKRHALRFICKEKIRRHKAGLESLFHFPGGRDLGQLAIVYKELDLNCQSDFARITELDAEVNSTFRSILEMQEKLQAIFKITKEEKHGRKLELKKLEATAESVVLKGPRIDFDLEVKKNSLENVMDSVQNIFDIASAFEGSVLAFLGSKGNTITPRNLEPAFHVLEHRISELVYMKAAYTLRKRVQVEGQPLPVIGARFKRKAGAVGGKGKQTPIGKPQSHGGFFKPRVFVGAGKSDISEQQQEALDSEEEKEPVSYRQVKTQVELQMATDPVNKEEHVATSDSESLELTEAQPEHTTSQFLDPSVIISTKASVASRVQGEHSTHEEFFRESVTTMRRLTLAAGKFRRSIQE